MENAKFKFFVKLACPTFSNYDCSTSELFQNLRRVISKARMMHSIVNNTAPEYLTSRFIGRCDLTSYNMRMNTDCNCNPLVTPVTVFKSQSL